MKSEKIITSILVMIAIINIILALLFFYQNMTIVNVNNKNQDYINSCLNKFVAFKTGKIDNIKPIKKVGIGNGWLGKYKIFLYYSLNNVEQLELYEGDTDEIIKEIRNYIGKNGYDLNKLGCILASISVLIIYKLINKKEKKIIIK